MKFLSQLFEARGTDLTSKSFVEARRKLVFIYIIIIALIIMLFSTLTINAVNQRFAEHTLSPNEQIKMTAEAAKNLAQTVFPEEEILRTEYDNENHQLLYEVYFTGGSKVAVDLMTGNILPDEAEHSNVLNFLYDDLAELISWLGLFVFLVTAISSIFIANATLSPIAESVFKQKRFVSDAAHELRNPLASLQTTLESYLRSGKKSEQLTESVAQDLLSEVKRLITTSESLLALEQVGMRVKQITECLVSENLDKTLFRLEPLIKENNISVIKEISKLPLKIDSVELDTILYNLIHNAIKYSSKNAELKITWNGKDLTVADNGFGIAPEHLPYIFDRFYKVDQARGFNNNSNGLGLALVLEIVNSYNGKIEVESEVEKGTKFTIKF